MQEGVKTIDIIRVIPDSFTKITDSIAIEEPLRILLVQESENGKTIRDAGITLRTPGHDDELAAGYLFSEGFLKNITDIRKIYRQQNDSNTIYLDLAVTPPFALQNKISPRNIYSSCGLCGTKSQGDLLGNLPLKTKREKLNIPLSLFFDIKKKLNDEQSLFRNTGGIHAAGLFNIEGELLLIREDIGRHNALDKICGHALIEKKLPLSSSILLLSGRTGFELVQKSAMAGIPVIAGIGAPSSLAIEAAEETGITLIGFLGKDKFNLYTCYDNIILASEYQGTEAVELLPSENSY
jgi:FdhD protein